MAKTLLLAWATPLAESEAEFNAWYDGTHIPELRAAVPSITAATRYRLAPVMPGAPEPPAAGRYLCVYELDEADAQAAAGALFGALGGGRVSQSTTMNMTDNPPALEFYSKI